MIHKLIADVKVANDKKINSSVAQKGNIPEKNKHIVFQGHCFTMIVLWT